VRVKKGSAGKQMNNLERVGAYNTITLRRNGVCWIAVIAIGLAFVIMLMKPEEEVDIVTGIQDVTY
jgi:hypothetical protein